VKGKRNGIHGSIGGASRELEGPMGWGIFGGGRVEFVQHASNSSTTEKWDGQSGPQVSKRLNPFGGCMGGERYKNYRGFS